LPIWRVVPDIGQANEMHTVIVEAVPAIALRALAVAGEIFLLARIKKIMLAWYVMDRYPERGVDLVSGIELLRFRGIADIPVCSISARRAGKAFAKVIAFSRVPATS
jgi:hypothetical protein